MMHTELRGQAKELIPDTQRLLEEIAYMEGRLAEIGHDGDCAYEKAIVRFFEQQVAERKTRLGVA